MDLSVNSINKTNLIAFTSKRKLEKIIADVESKSIITDLKSVKAELLQAYTGVKPTRKKVAKTVEEVVTQETQPAQNIVTETAEEVVAPKRGRGRPKGSKNKPKITDNSSEVKPKVAEEAKVEPNIPKEMTEEETIEFINNNLPKNYKYVSYQKMGDGTIKVSCKFSKRGRRSEAYTASANTTTFILDPKKVKSKTPKKTDSAEKLLADELKNREMAIEHPTLIFNGKICHFPNQVVPRDYKLSYAYQGEKDANTVFLGYEYIGVPNPNAKKSILVKANLLDLVEKFSGDKVKFADEVSSKQNNLNKNVISKIRHLSELSDEELAIEFDKLCRTEEMENLMMSNEDLFNVVVNSQKTRDRKSMIKFLDTFNVEKEGLDYEHAGNKFMSEIRSQESEKVVNKLISETLNPKNEAENALIVDIQKAFGDKIAQGEYKDIISILKSYNGYKNMPKRDKTQILKIIKNLQQNGDNEQISWLLSKIIKNEYVNVDTVISCVKYSKNSYGEKIVSGEYGKVILPSRVKKEICRKNLSHLLPKFEEAMKSVVPATGHSGVKLNTSGGTTDWVAEIKLVDSKYRLRSSDGITFDKLVEKKTNKS